MMKILKSEGRAQDQLLKANIKELSRLQKIQKVAAKVKFHFQFDSERLFRFCPPIVRAHVHFSSFAHSNS